MDFKVTQPAEDKIREAALANGEVPVLRIYVERATCSSARFGIAFDDIKAGDEVNEINGIKYVTDTEYVPVYTNGIYIDYVTEPKEGFIIDSLHQVIRSGGGCGGGCGSGGCSGCGH